MLGSRERRGYDNKEIASRSIWAVRSDFYPDGNIYYTNFYVLKLLELHTLSLKKVNFTKRKFKN